VVLVGGSTKEVGGATEAVRSPRQRSLAPAGIVLGLGLGGFVDGIVLHQIAQWHNMLSSTDRWPTTTLEGMQANMRGDGLFHAATWILVALGVWLLWRALRGGALGSGREVVGWMLVGWGMFNLVEGIVDHTILGLHHVREGGNELPWDLGFLALGVVMIVGGWFLVRSGGRTLHQPLPGPLQSSGS
jgi:uncharacterized membrane protein